MFCTALISAFVIIKAGIEPWTPPVGVLLPVVGTVLNPVLLLLSGVLLHQAGRWFATENNTTLVRTLLGGPEVSGVCFILVQGYEWMRLIAYGMTMTSGIFGACFFLLIGMHGFHAAAADLTMVSLYIRLTRHTLRLDRVRAMQVFWYFVVGIWPVYMGWCISKEGGPHVWPETSWSVARPDHPWHGVTGFCLSGVWGGPRRYSLSLSHDRSTDVHRSARDAWRHGVLPIPANEA